MVHEVPSHFSASVFIVDPAGLANPTAMHVVADVQAMSPRTLIVAPLGFGLGWMVQVLPFQTSASVC